MRFKKVALIRERLEKKNGKPSKEETRKKCEELLTHLVISGIRIILYTMRILNVCNLLDLHLCVGHFTFGTLYTCCS